MIGLFIERLVRAVMASPARWAAVALAVTAVGLYGAGRITLEDDARTMIAGADPDIATQLEALSQFSAVDQLLIHLDGAGVKPREEVTAALERAAVALVAVLLESGRFTTARFEAAPGQQWALAEALLPRRFLLDPRDPAMLLAPAALEQQLADTRARLLAPQGMAQKVFLLRDPMGSLNAALGSLSSAPGLSKLDARSGRFFSQDGKSLLVIAAPKGNPFGRDASAHSMEVLRAAAVEVARVAPDVVVRPIGAHRFTDEAQRTIMHDVHQSAALTLVIVIVIFVAFFRRVRLALVALPPLLFGAAVAGGVAGLWGRPIHGIVLAFSAACLGLSIDYTIHLLAARPTEPGMDRAQGLPQAARRVGASLLLAVLSTAAGLLTLALSRVDALAQMAVLGTAAVAGCFAGNLLWVPILLPLLGKGMREPPVLRGPWAGAVRLAGRRPGAVVVTATLLAVLFSASAARTTVDGDMRNLDTRSVQGAQDEAAFTAAFGDPGAGGLVLCEGAQLDEALARAEQVTRVLTGLSGVRVMSPAVVAPSTQVAAARRAAWCNVTPPPAAAIDAAAVRLGFRPNSFAGFAEELAGLCDGSFAVLADPRPALEAFSALLGRPIAREHQDRVRLAVAFEAEERLLPELTESVAAAGGVLVHRASLNRRLVEIISSDLPRLGGIALALVTLLLIFAFRDLGRTVRALAPCLLGMAATLGVLAALGTPINLMNLCVFPLLAGLGIDYGILMVDLGEDAGDNVAAERAFSVTVAAATTLAGFGTLAVARYYAIATIGRSVLLAVTACALFALFLPVALQRLGMRRRSLRTRA